MNFLIIGYLWTMVQNFSLIAWVSRLGFDCYFCSDVSFDVPFRNDHKLIAEINSIQSSWKAGPYRHFERYTVRQLLNMAGGTRASRLRFVQNQNICFSEFADFYLISSTREKPKINCFCFQVLLMQPKLHLPVFQTLLAVGNEQHF